MLQELPTEKEGNLAGEEGQSKMSFDLLQEEKYPSSTFFVESSHLSSTNETISEQRGPLSLRPRGKANPIVDYYLGTESSLRGQFIEKMKVDAKDLVYGEKFGKKGWYCPRCGNFNFSNRARCNLCFLKIKHRKKEQYVKYPGDWKCLRCNNVNYSYREKCNRCNYQKSLFV